MKHFSTLFFFLLLLLNSFCQSSSSDYNIESVLPYGTGSWDSEQLGNHRVVLYVNSPTDAVRVHIPWRRRDKHPGQKRIILTDTTGKQIENLKKLI